MSDAPSDHVDVLPASKPVAPQPVFLERAKASYYSSAFVGRRTANGEFYRHSALTAAHPSLPFGTLVMVKRRSSGRSVVVRINDRGPYARGRRMDLSREAAKKLGILHHGVADVDLFVINGRTSTM